MVALSIAFLVIIFLGYLILYAINDNLANFYLVTLFLFAAPNISEGVGFYYSIMLLTVLVFGLLIPAAQVDRDNVSFTGILISVGLGVGVYFLMQYMQSQSAQAIIGVPSLQINVAVQQTLSPAYTAVLGIIENKFVFTTLDILLHYGPLLFSGLSVIIAPLIAASVFAIFHLSAFDLALSSLIFAALVAGIWIIFYTAYSQIVAHTAHYLWNAVISVQRTFSIVGVNPLQ